MEQRNCSSRDGSVPVAWLLSVRVVTELLPTVLGVTERYIADALTCGEVLETSAEVI